MASLPQNKFEFSGRTTTVPRHDESSASTHRGNAPSPHLLSNPELLVAPGLSIALIGPNDARRGEAVFALEGCAGTEICEFSSYPAEMDAACKMLEESYEVVMIDLDSDPEYALDLVESIASRA